MRKPIAMIFASLMIATVFLFGLIVSEPGKPQDLAAAEPAVHDVVDSILKERRAEIAGEGDVAFGSDSEINILAIGLDSRKEGREQHCDAIHMITLRLDDWSIAITSVPRGTLAALPPGGEYEEHEYYLANACAYGGLHYGIRQIEQIVGVKADYVATVGFSQALGIFRVLDLPTTETLQWLRHRRSYQIGDPQRSHNQAVFMKDMALRLTGGESLPVPFLYIIYSLIDTDMDFKTAKALYDAYYVSGIGERPEDIRLQMRPYYKVADYHFDPQNAEGQVQVLIDFLKGRVSEQDLSLRTIEDVQRELENYLRRALASEETVIHVYEEQMWRQLEDEEVREELHFRFLDKYVREIREEEPGLALQAVTDYVLEKEYFGLTAWEEKGKRFLEVLTEKE